MVEQDTIRLLRECDAGVKMGVSSIEDVLEKAQNDDLKRLLREYRKMCIRDRLRIAPSIFSTQARI